MAEITPKPINSIFDRDPRLDGAILDDMQEIIEAIEYMGGVGGLDESALARIKILTDHVVPEGGKQGSDYTEEHAKVAILLQQMVWNELGNRHGDWPDRLCSIWCKDLGYKPEDITIEDLKLASEGVRFPFF